jgi:hypothetical protein
VLFKPTLTSENSIQTSKRIQVSDTCQQKLYAEEQPQHVSGITSTECNVNTHKLTLLTFSIEGLAGNVSYLTTCMLACRADFMLL